MTTRPLTLLATAALAALALTACGSADDAEPETTSFGLAGDHLTIAKESGGGIELQPGDVDGVEVTRWFAGEPGEATWEFDDDELTLGTDCGLGSSCEVRYRVTVPRAVAVTLEGSNGDVAAAGFGTPLTIHTENGGITVEDVSGDLTLRSSSGDQQANGVTSRHVDAETHNGAVDLVFADAPADLAVSTENGAVTVDLPEAGYAVTVETESGSVENALTGDAGSPYTIGVTTESGDISLG